MQPKFQVFVSSTFRDLKDERQAALEAIWELGHFPSGMEAFPAADATPWELIRSMIEDSDYYVLIVGGRYGSTGSEGISYTEMEYNLALELKKPVLAFVHAAPEQIPVGKAELEPEARQKLEEFRDRVTERHCKGWTSKEELKAAILLALVHAIRTKPAYGWIRNEGLQNQELLRRLADLQGRYDALEAEASELRLSSQQRIDSRKFQSIDEQYEIKFKARTENVQYSAVTSWSELFYGLADEMLIPCYEQKLLDTLKPLVISALSPDEVKHLTRFMSFPGKLDHLAKDIEIDTSVLLVILRQLMATGLIEPQMVLRQGGDQLRTYTAAQRCWILTRVGRDKYLEKRAFLADEK